MTPRLEQELFIRDTLAEVTPIIRARHPDAEIESDFFDAFTTILHGPEVRIGGGEAFAIARELRKGRDVNHDTPTDWHVRALTPHLFLTDQGDHPRERERIGTEIWFSRTYALPEGYDETGDPDRIAAPGVALPI